MVPQISLPTARVRVYKTARTHKDREGKIYKTKSGGIWRKNFYFRRGVYDEPRGWIRYKEKRR